MDEAITYAIGDIHGCHDLLVRLLWQIRSHTAGRKYRLVFMGDYIDRGPDSALVVRTVDALAYGIKGRNVRWILDADIRSFFVRKWLKAGVLDRGLAVGDFDADGIDDVFVGTGAAWYFSSGGRAEWRYLNQMPEKASALRFGDFDGDGRTDVMALHNGRIDISWAGGSPWQTVNVTAWALSDLAVGDFDGDRRSDLFLATDAAWFMASSARDWAPCSTWRPSARLERRPAPSPRAS